MNIVLYGDKSFDMLSFIGDSRRCDNVYFSTLVCRETFYVFSFPVSAPVYDQLFPFF